MSDIKKYFTNRRVVFFVVLLAVIISSVIPVTRLLMGKPIFAGETPYYDLRLSESIKQHGLVFGDDMIYGGREYLVKPYHLILSLALNFVKPEYLILIPIFASLVSLMLFYLLLKELKLNIRQKFFIMLVLLLSPSFIFISGTLNEFSISIMLILAGLYLFIRSDRILPSLFIFLISILFGLINSIVILFLMLFVSGIEPEKQKKAKTILVSTIVFSFLYHTSIYFTENISSRFQILGVNHIQAFISDLGGLFGIGAYAVILAGIGIIITWEYKQKLKNIYYLMIALILTALYFDHALIYLNFFISIFAGLAFTSLLERRWEMEFLEEFTILIMVYGLLFSAISYTERSIVSEPNINVQQSLNWLDHHSDPEDNIFSHYSNGFWIEYFAGRPVITDSLFDYQDAKIRFDDSNEIFYSRDLEKTKQLLDKYKIRYIFIDSAMKNGQIWDEKKGLWYLLSNSETFNNVYEKNNIEIWEYKLLTE